MLLLPVFTRFLTPTDYGIVAIASLITVILMPVILVNLHGALARFYFDYRENQAELRSYLSAILTFYLLWAVLISTALLLLGGFLARVAGIPQYPFIPIAVVAAVVSGITSLKLNYWRAAENSLKYLLMRLGVYFTGLGLAIVFVVGLDGGAEGRFWGPFLGTCAGGIVALFLFRKELSRPRLTAKHIRPSLAFGAPLVPHAMFKEVVALSDRVIVNHFRTLAETGLLSVGYALANGFSMVLVGINAAWSPFVFNLIATRGDDARMVLSRLTSYYVLSIVVLGVGLSLFAKELIILLAAPAFREAYTVVPILTFGFIFKGLYYMVVAQIFYAKKTKWILFATVGSGVLNLALNWAWIPGYGMAGAAWASLFSYVAVFLITWYVSWQVYPIRYEVRTGVVLFAAVPIVAGGFWLEQTSIISQWLSLAMRIGLMAGLGAFAVTFYLTRSELRAAVSLGKRSLAWAGILGAGH